MTSFLTRAAIVALCYLPQLALGDAARSGSAPIADQAEIVGEVPLADDVITIILSDPVEATSETKPVSQMMPADFYLGDNCDHVAPVLTV